MNQKNEVFQEQIQIEDQMSQNKQTFQPPWVESMNKMAKAMEEMAKRLEQLPNQGQRQDNLIEPPKKQIQLEKVLDKMEQQGIKYPEKKNQKLVQEEKVKLQQNLQVLKKYPNKKHKEIKIFPPAIYLKIENPETLELANLMQGLAQNGIIKIIASSKQKFNPSSKDPLIIKFPENKEMKMIDQHISLNGQILEQMMSFCNKQMEKPLDYHTISAIIILYEWVYTHKGPEPQEALELTQLQLLVQSLQNRTGSLKIQQFKRRTNQNRGRSQSNRSQNRSRQQSQGQDSYQNRNRDQYSQQNYSRNSSINSNGRVVNFQEEEDYNLNNNNQTENNQRNNQNWNNYNSRGQNQGRNQGRGNRNNRRNGRRGRNRGNQRNDYY